MASSQRNAEGSNDAAVYVRMSTEHQQYSTSNQMDVIREFAKRRGMTIVKTYSDEGKSGLNIRGRTSLTKLISDVEGGKVPFKHILVYDVSRWGRFQDADEGAFYEFLCRRAGLSVHYCAEQFDNDGSSMSTIIKSIKRTMAGEYSRELSAKVFQGACRLIQLGFKQGGRPGFGLRRMLVNQSGEHKSILEAGEYKSIQTDRVILVLGPESETETVKWMYEQFVEQKLSEGEISESLNKKAILTHLAGPWTRGMVHEVLTNEKYIGNNVYHRTSFKLKKKHVTNPPEMWIRAEGVFPGIVGAELFLAAQEIILGRSRKMTDEEMLAFLRNLLSRHGKISGILIDELEDAPSSSAFRHRFGSLVSAYHLIGYHPAVDFRFLETNRKLRQKYPEILGDTIKQIQALGCTVVQDPISHVLNINGEISVSIVLCRHTETAAGASRWIIRLDQSLKPDLTIAVRMNPSGETVRDYYILPAIDMSVDRLRVAEYNGVYLDAYKFETLDYLYHIIARVTLEEAA